MVTISPRISGLKTTLTVFCNRDCFKIATCAKNAGIVNKLVTIFARHLDSFILTKNFSLIYQIRDFGSGQILQPRQIRFSPGFAKIAPWWLAHRDSFSAKVPGLVSVVGATNAYCPYQRAVRHKRWRSCIHEK
jgi:hypothetical protein